MKSILMLTTVVLLLALGAGTALAQSGYDLFQKALVKERAVGDVEEALRLYQRIVKEFAGNHALAAKAELRMGLLYDRLGRKVDAQRAYQAVVSQYADQANEARQARAKIVVAAQPRNIKASARTTAGLTAREVWDGNPGWTPAISFDGRHLTYVGSGKALYVRDVLTGESRRLTMVGSARDMEGVTSGPVFSPDGKLVAYGWYDKERTDLRLITLDGAVPRVLNRSDEWTALAPFDWSSDGKQILALARARGQNGTPQIVLVSVADGSVHSLKTLDGDSSPQKMSLSPDGRYIVYDYPARGLAERTAGAGAPFDDRDIFILGADGGHEARLATQNRRPVWTPDGRGVVFGRLRGTVGFWFLRVADGKPQGSPALLTPNIGEGPMPIGFTRNGSFYYKLQSETTELYVAALDLTSGIITDQPATVTQRSDTGGGEWSPDGQSLAFASQRPKAYFEVAEPIIVIRSGQTGEEKELAPALSAFDIRSWSPDSRFLLVHGADKEKRRGFYRVDARTGDVTPLHYDKPGESVSHSRWFPNEKSIVFIGRDSAGQRIGLRDLETGRETELYRPPTAFLLGSCVEVSADGRHLAFYLRDPKARTMWVMVVTTTGESPRELGPRVKYPDVIDHILALTPDGRHVLFSTYDREQEQLGHKVWRIALEGGGPQEIQFPKEVGYFGVASIHPDGKRIAFIADNSKSAVWVRENFVPATPTRKTTASRR